MWILTDCSSIRMDRIGMDRVKAVKGRRKHVDVHLNAGHAAEPS